MYKGNYIESLTYDKDDTVLFGNVIYLAKIEVPENIYPTNTSYWKKTTTVIDLDGNSSCSHQPYILKCRSILDIRKTKTEGLEDTYTIFYTDNTTSEFIVTNGENSHNVINDEVASRTTSYSSSKVEDLLNDINNKIILYSDLRKLDTYFYDISFDNLDYTFAKEYFKQYDPITGAGECSSARNGRWYIRSFDWKYDNNLTLAVHTPHTSTSFAVDGFVGALSITEDELINNPYDYRYKLIPFHIVDGHNEYGLYANSNVVSSLDYGVANNTTPLIEKRDTICSTMLVRYILDHFKTASEAVNYIKNYVSIYTSQERLDEGFATHYMIADKDDTFILEFINNNISIVECPIMTNFHVTDVIFNEDKTVTINRDGSGINESNIAIHDTGLERFNLIAEDYDTLTSKTAARTLLNKLQYTNTYKPLGSEDIWYTEYSGIGDLNITSEESEYTSAVSRGYDMYSHRSRDEESQYYGTWQSTHQVIYDMENNIAYITVQESDKEFIFKLDAADYATETFVTNAIQEAIGGALNGSY